MDQFELIYWDPNYNEILLLNLAIIIGVFTSIRLFSGTLAHTNATDELTRKDNPAFGISLSGMVFAVTIILLGAIFSEPAYNMMDSVMAVGLYGIIGIVLMAITRIVFDKIYLPNISIRDEILKGNVTAGIIDASHVIATAVVIRAIMMWITVNTMEAVQAVLIGFILSQVLLSVTTVLRVKMFSRQNGGKSIQDAFREGNIALALQFSGYRLGAAFAIAAASNIMVYEINDIYVLFMAWAGVSILMMLGVGVLSWLAQRIILAGIDVNDEVVRQKNIAIGIIQGVIYLSLGVLIAGLME
ncbi:MAG: DUF350 domain-containing protein [Alphaproteobacteria bacterium]|nr:DUF350 domain-containing protein [Alphaproteobacteria bacterium]